MGSHFKSTTESGKAIISEKAALHKKHKQELSTGIHVTSGKKFVPTTLGRAMMRQQADGLIYFDKEPDVFYKLVDFEWDGPSYKTVTHTDTKGTTRGRSKRTGRLLGAAVGTMFAPGIGTVIGAGVGTGNKKSKGKTHEHSVSYDEEVEVSSPAAITLEKVDTKEKLRITIDCDTKIGNVIKNMALSE
jgi:hypothetical protein